MNGCMDVWMDVPMYVWMYLCSIFVNSGPTEWAGPGTCPGQPAAPCAQQSLEAPPAPPPRGAQKPRMAADPEADQAPPGWPEPIGQDRGKGMSFSTYPR